MRLQRLHPYDPPDTVTAVEPASAAARQYKAVIKAVAENKLTENKLTENKLTPKEERDYDDSTIHEVTHGLLADHFGLRPRIAVVAAKEGVTVFDSTNDRQVNAAVSYGFIGPLIDRGEINDQNYEKVLAEVRARPEKFGASSTDRRHISDYDNTYAAKGTYLWLTAPEQRAATDYLVAHCKRVFKPAIIDARYRSQETIWASVDYKAHAKDGQFPAQARISEKLRPFEEADEAADKAAQAASAAASKLSVELRQLGKHAASAVHREAEKLHRAAASRWFEAVETASDKDVAYAVEYVAQRKAGDMRGARMCAFAVNILEPWRRNRRGEKHLDEAELHSKAAGGAK